jgi:putative flippase GtrA
MKLTRITAIPKQVPIWLRWMRFNLAGAVGVLVQMAVLSFTTRVFGLDYLVATGIAVECALLHNFVWHECYTWQEHRLSRSPLDIFMRLARFNMSVGGFSLIGNIILMRLLVGNFKLPLLLANLLTIGLLSVGNFLISEHHVFKEPVTDH